MKAKDAQVEFDQHQIMLFVEQEDGSYGPLQTGSYVTKTYVGDLLKNLGHFHETSLKQLVNNEISPIAFYIILRQMTPADAAARIGISTAQVKKHMTPKFFGTMKLDTAKKYADVFGVPVANLFQISIQSKTGFIDPELLEQKKTKNPFVVTIA